MPPGEQQATLLEVSIATPLEGKSVEGKSVDLDEVNGSVWVGFECLGGSGAV